MTIMMYTLPREPKRSRNEATKPDASQTARWIGLQSHARHPAVEEVDEAQLRLKHGFSSSRKSTSRSVEEVDEAQLRLKPL